ncbi:MAG: hypothetical protein HY606_13235 [Planctomycetes bacterium]|nr:hypothetical protein [Planctomycetota bacterium]
MAIKRSALAKRGLEFIDEVKKRQVEVLIGNDEPLLTDAFSEFIKKVIKDKYDLKVRSAFYGEDLLELAENSAVDIFILVLNNIMFRPDYPLQERLENSLQLITQIKTTYGRPVISLSGLIEDSSLIARAKLSADFFFPLPFEPDAFMEAIEKCLDMLTEFDEIQRKKSEERVMDI